MLVTFSCDAHENITMFGSVAQKLLLLMGNSGTVPGAILADDVPDALNRLQHAIDHGPSKTSIKQPSASNDEDDEPEVSLIHRAIPLIALLENAVKHHRNVMWDWG